MTNEMQTKIVEVIDALALQLGVAKEFVWEVLKTQQYVCAIQLLIVTLMLGTTAAIMYRIMRRGFANEFDSYDENFTAQIFGVIGTVLCTAFGTAALMSGIGRLVNPAYYALREVLRTFGGS